MQNYTLTMLMLFLLSTFSQAQNTDSIFAIWRDETQPDTIRLKAIYDYAWDGFLFSQPDSAYYYSQMQYDFAKAKGAKKPMADALNTQGVSLYLRADYTEAIEHYMRSLKIMEEIGNKKGIAAVLNNIGNSYKYQGNYTNAIDYYNRSIKIFEEIGDVRGIASALGNIGIIYKDQGNYAMAIDDYTRSLKVLEEMGDQRGIAISLRNIGSIYFEQGDYDKAMEYYTRSLNILEETGDKQGIVGSLGNMGNTCKEQGDYSRAIEYYTRSLTIAEEIGDKMGVSSCLNNIGLVYRALGDYANAIDYFNRSLKIDEEIGDKSGTASSLNNMGDLFANQGEYRKALEYCTRSVQLAQEVGAVIQTRNAAKSLWKVYKNLGNYKQSLEMYELYTQMRDSILSEENEKEVIRQEYKYTYEKQAAADSVAGAKAVEIKNAQIAQQQAEIKARKNQQYGLFSGLALMIALAGVFFLQRNRISKEKDRSEELLLNILPAETARELKDKGSADAKHIDHVSVLFTDFKGFTQMSEKVTPRELVHDLHECFSAFDHICEKYGIEKIKTIGDAYMAAGGIPLPDEKHAEHVVRAAFEMRDFVEAGKIRKITANLPYFEIRIGIHSGPVVAGIVGVKKFQYDIWGDTVNTASRMESSGQVGRVNISQATFELLRDNPSFSFENRGKLKAKGKGEIAMYFVIKSNES